jgi:hypothetical protein
MRDERLRLPTTVLTLDEYLESGRGRVAFTWISALGLAILGGRAADLPALRDFWIGASLSALIHDDVCDWMDDYRTGRYSYLHLHTLAAPPFRAEVQAGALPSSSELGVALFLSDTAEALYDTAFAEAQRAYAAIAGCGFPRQTAVGQRAVELVARHRQAMMNRKYQLLLKM